MLVLTTWCELQKNPILILFYWCFILCTKECKNPFIMCKSKPIPKHCKPSAWIVASSYSSELPSEATELARGFINSSSKIQSFSSLSEPLLSLTRVPVPQIPSGTPLPFSGRFLDYCAPGCLELWKLELESESF